MTVNEYGLSAIELGNMLVQQLKFNETQATAMVDATGVVGELRFSRNNDLIQLTYSGGYWEYHQQPYVMPTPLFPEGLT